MNDEPGLMRRKTSHNGNKTPVDTKKVGETAGQHSTFVRRQVTNSILVGPLHNETSRPEEGDPTK